MPVLEDDVLLFEAVEDEEMAEAVGRHGQKAKEAGCSCCRALEQTTWKRSSHQLFRPLSPVAA